MESFKLKLPERIFENRARRTAIVTTLAFHLGVLMLMAFWTCSTPTQPELTEIVLGGSGGSPDSKAPADEAQHGTKTATPKPVERVKPQPDPKKIETPQTRSHSEETIPTTKKDPKPKEQTQTTTEPSKTPEKPSEQAGQREDGRGTKPAGGTGGSTSGYSVDGLGNRGWLSSPGPRYPDGANASGVVVLRFTVMPNGDVTNIVPIKRADQALVSAAIAGLRRARARPLPSTVPQIPQQGTITCTFVLK